MSSVFYPDFSTRSTLLGSTFPNWTAEDFVQERNMVETYPVVKPPVFFKEQKLEAFMD
jgi:hypothetical protein